MWIAMGELIVLSTLTPTRDHMPISPYCTTLAGHKLKGEICLWSDVGAKGLNLCDYNDSLSDQNYKCNSQEELYL